MHDGLAWFYRLFFSVRLHPQHFYAAVTPSGGSERRAFILTRRPNAVKEPVTINRSSLDLRTPAGNLSPNEYPAR
ncbi:MAG: hypothetical protein P8Z41_12560 [Anaerolineales bacterium]